MKLSKRSYPHPVVGNGDDVPGVAFQAAVEMSTDKENAYLDVTINCSSADINRLIEDGAAKLVLHIECSNTVFRKAYDFCDFQHRIVVPIQNLNESVEVNTFVCATRRISSYSNAKAHPDYAGAAFEINVGDILAIGEGRIFHIESQFDSFNRVGSIMQIMEELKETGDLPVKANFNADKIVVILSKPDFKTYKLMKSNESISSLLTTAIVVPVLIEAIHLIRDNDDETGGDDDGRKWVRLLRRKLKEAELENETDCLLCVQRLLELPIKRALATSVDVANADS